MERLTIYESECKRGMICRYEDCDTCEEYCPYLNEDDCPCLQEILKKLAEYEDLEEQGKLLKLSEAVKIKKDVIEEEDILKFYYCESEDEYYIGKRIDTMYYAKYSQTGFVWFMSRNLPWGEHVVDPKSLWKEHTYPSEPKEIPFFEWLQGFMKKECLGTVEECREAVRIKKDVIENVNMQLIAGKNNYKEVYDSFYKIAAIVQKATDNGSST